MKKTLLYSALTIFALISFGFNYYPIDGYNQTGITRLLQLEKIVRDSIKYTRIPAGAYFKLSDIKLNLVSRSKDSVGEIMVEDPDFEKELGRVIPNAGYSAAVMDMTNPDKLRYAAFRETVGYQPGSVGKIAVITALFTQLKNLCPDSWDQRVHYLKTIRKHSRYWGLGDHHTIPIYNPETDKLTKRKVIASDEFSLYEWADHMLSVSNNGAASIVWREALLMAGLGQDYFTTTEEEQEQWFKDTPRDTLTNLANRVVNEPLRNLGISKDEWRLGSFFTTSANKYVSDKGGSIGTPVGLMKYLVQLEQGNVVDRNSSLEIKRLLYMTDRRIRYAYSKELDSAAVYFKSGSLYKCDREKNPDCAAYAGNVYNYMNSVIIVEHPNDVKYIVVLETNVLNKNSAGAHMYLASAIDKIINRKEETD
ncbi:serine hydrolase [Aegicerativicinus sediminis]